MPSERTPHRHPNRRVPSTLFVVVLVLLVVAGHWMSFGGGTPLWSDLRNAMHVPGFTVVTLLSFAILHYSGYSQRPSVVIAALLLLAVIAESGQALTAREPSFTDLAADLAGILSAMLLLHATARWQRVSRSSSARWGLGAMAALGLLICTLPLMITSYALVAQREALPNLLTFDERWDARLYRHAWPITTLEVADTRWPDSTGRIAKVRMDDAELPGLEFAPYPDWSAYAALSFVAAAPETRRLTVRVHDRAHDGEYDDRFTRSFEIGPAPSRYTIPLNELAETPSGRRMDLAEIRSIVFFYADPQPGDVAYFDSIALVGR